MAVDPVSDVKIAEVTEVAQSVDGSLILKAVGVVADVKSDLEIAITTDLAPKIALALLATTAEARAGRDDEDPALECLAADASLQPDEETLRLKLLFEQGAVLPVEMPVAAAECLSEQLDRALSGEDTPGTA